MAGKEIIVCDDEPELRESLIEYLESRGYEVRGASNGEALAHLLSSRQPDLVVLDVRMPKVDGLTALKAIRSESQLPVIMLTAADDSVDRILGLELGADDYVGKPVDPRELEARIRAVLRRSVQPEVERASAEDVVSMADMSLDLAGARLFAADGSEVALTAMEFALLQTLVANEGRVLSREQLLDQSHDRDLEPFDRSIDLRISRLRRKIQAGSAYSTLIRTVRGIGYMFDPKP